MHFKVAAGPPSDLEVTDVDEDSVSLSWNKPRKNGGGKISGYMVEYKPASPGGEWTKAPGAGGKDPMATGEYYSHLQLIFQYNLA